MSRTNNYEVPVRTKNYVRMWYGTNTILIGYEEQRMYVRQYMLIVPSVNLKTVIYHSHNDFTQ